MNPDVTRWLLTASDRDNPHTRVDDAHPGEQAWSTGNRVRPLVDGATYFAELHDVLEATTEGDLVMFGSLTLLHALLPEDVIDEVHVIVGNAATGGGTPLFPSATPRLRLLGTWRGEGSDNVVLQYATH